MSDKENKSVNESAYYVVGGGECPKCKNFGIFNHGSFTICENCLTYWDKDPRKFPDAKEIKK